MNSTERAFYGSPFWAQKGTFFKCSDKNESFYLQKVCFSDREKFSEPYRLHPHPKIGKTQHNALYESRCGVGTKFYRGFVVTPTDLY
ncbi:hypothetical protein LEP1GSC107_1710 [Leptospira interrogans serovar Grippotyphosa str. UI 12769]|uniref:Uncharacterized protein n=2 Tax=Leptospira interrogans TaxID=173 RepID=M6H9H3_LEPIR|nr:hypothetical protein LEP1GSC097_1276 [Leptospira interrogans serovar Grippotyphosa str. UI 08368]EMG20062.1 hypothetical protein LEP1GSC150_4962 [Leptospira interrogans serovar Copenhageni str. LT2050]EMM93720.1 hypothetical protein LEP1GSC158_4563 [Leptospira interrogans serovar Zanoni str. LT2156]EMN84084.1 hypothetical protein LEP1GSC107_1710 [Leptospira interrogans serovar Grippotyphosa str. UI 12769]